MGRIGAGVGAGVGAGIRLLMGRGHGKQLPRPVEIFGLAPVGQQAVVADAVEAQGQDVDEEAADELAWRQGHGLVPLAPLGSVVLSLEGDTPVVEPDQAAVGDGDAVGVAGQVGEHRLGSGEGTLGVDYPLDFA
jgi:hypothetical protein